MAGQAFDLLRGSHFELDGHLVTFISQNQVLSLWYERTLMNFEDFLPTVDGSINRHQLKDTLQKFQKLPL